MLANRRKERAQRKGTTCSVQCPKCQLLFLSEVSLKHHFYPKKDFKQFVTKPVNYVKYYSHLMPKKIVLKTMTQKEKLILNVHIIQLFLKQLNHLLIQRMHELFHAHLNLLVQQMKQIFRLTWMFYRTRTFALRYNIY